MFIVRTGSSSKECVTPYCYYKTDVDDQNTVQFDCDTANECITNDVTDGKCSMVRDQVLCMSAISCALVYVLHVFQFFMFSAICKFAEICDLI